MIELVKRLWNGRYGRLARRDIWVYKHTVWRVRSRIGDADSRSVERTFDAEDAAVAHVDRLLRTGGDGWRDITAAYDGHPKPSQRGDTDVKTAPSRTRADPSESALPPGHVPRP